MTRDGVGQCKRWNPKIWSVWGAWAIRVKVNYGILVYSRNDGIGRSVLHVRMEIVFLDFFVFFVISYFMNVFGILAFFEFLRIRVKLLN